MLQHKPRDWDDDTWLVYRRLMTAIEEHRPDTIILPNTWHGKLVTELPETYTYRVTTKNRHTVLVLRDGREIYVRMAQEAMTAMREAIERGPGVEGSPEGGD